MAPEIVRTETVMVAAVRATIPMTEITGFFDRSFTELASALAGQQVEPAGPAYARYFGVPGDTVDVEVGFPVTEPVRTQGEMYPTSLPAGRVVRTVHQGSYDGLSDSWRALWEWIVARGLDPADELWEVYLTEPSPQTDPATLRTELDWPLRS